MRRDTSAVSGAISAPVYAALCMGAALLLSLLAGCGSVADEKTRAAEQDLSDTYSAALADGVLGSQEVVLLTSKMEAFASAVKEQAESVDWAALGGTMLGSALLALLGARAAPNSLLLGRAEARALDKVAGGGP